MKKLALGFASAAALLLGSALAQPPRPDAGSALPSAGRPGPGPHAMAGCECMQMMHGGGGGPGMPHRGGMGAPGQMQMDGGMGPGAMACPGMEAIGSIRAESTRDGAVLRFTARSPAQAPQVQAHVQMMARCMSAHHAAGGAQGADAGTPQR